MAFGLTSLINFFGILVLTSTITALNQNVISVDTKCTGIFKDMKGEKWTSHSKMTMTVGEDETLDMNTGYKFVCDRFINDTLLIVRKNGYSSTKDYYLCMKIEELTEDLLKIQFLSNNGIMGSIEDSSIPLHDWRTLCPQYNTIQDWQFSMYIKQGTKPSIVCPEELHAHWYLVMPGNLEDCLVKPNMDVCESSRRLRFQEKNCSNTEITKPRAGTYDCLYHTEFNSTKYLVIRPKYNGTIEEFVCMTYTVKLGEVGIFNVSMSGAQPSDSFTCQKVANAPTTSSSGITAFAYKKDKSCVVSGSGEATLLPVIGSATRVRMALWSGIMATALVFKQL